MRVAALEYAIALFRCILSASSYYVAISQTPTQPSVGDDAEKSSSVPSTIGLSCASPSSGVGASIQSDIAPTHRPCSVSLHGASPNFATVHRNVTPLDRWYPRGVRRWPMLSPIHGAQGSSPSLTALTLLRAFYDSARERIPPRVKSFPPTGRAWGALPATLPAAATRLRGLAPPLRVSRTSPRIREPP